MISEYSPAGTSLLIRNALATAIAKIEIFGDEKLVQDLREVGNHQAGERLRAVYRVLALYLEDRLAEKSLKDPSNNFTKRTTRA